MKLDQIGIWSEIKLEIIKEYASVYTKIMSNKEWCKGYVYIDAFAGAGIHIRKKTGELIPGSPLNALEVEPRFTEYHYIDLDEDKVKLLEELVREHLNVNSYHGDCNEILVNNIFPTLTYKTFKRALCILDPYKLNLRWETTRKAAELKTVEIFLNFPIMDANRNILFEDLSKVEQEDIDRMTAFWGDKSWMNILYKKEKDLFGRTFLMKIKNFKTLADEFRKRLKNMAQFEYVPEPILMSNTKNGPLYFLYFASQQNVANKIINDIFNKYRWTM